MNVKIREVVYDIESKEIEEFHKRISAHKIEDRRCGKDTMCYINRDLFNARRGHYTNATLTQIMADNYRYFQLKVTFLGEGMGTLAHVTKTMDFVFQTIGKIVAPRKTRTRRTGAKSKVGNKDGRFKNGRTKVY